MRNKRERRRRRRKDLVVVIQEQFWRENCHLVSNHPKSINSRIELGELQACLLEVAGAGGILLGFFIISFAA